MTKQIIFLVISVAYLGFAWAEPETCKVMLKLSNSENGLTVSMKNNVSVLGAQLTIAGRGNAIECSSPHLNHDCGFNNSDPGVRLILVSLERAEIPASKGFDELLSLVYDTDVHHSEFEIVEAIVADTDVMACEVKF